MVDYVATTQAELEQTEAYDTGDKEQVNNSRKKTARLQADRLEFVRASMSFPQGRAWFHDLLFRTKLFSSPFISGDPCLTAFRCGEQNIGLQVLADIQDAAPEEYITMISENRE